jgi:hypothetical protein
MREISTDGGIILDMDSPTLSPVIASSSNPSQVANTIKGLIVSASSVIVLLAAHVFGVTLTPDNVLNLGTDVGMLAGAVWFVYGLIHKGVVTLGRVR